MQIHFLSWLLYLCFDLFSVYTEELIDDFVPKLFVLSLQQASIDMSLYLKEVKHRSDLDYFMKFKNCIEQLG